MKCFSFLSIFLLMLSFSCKERAILLETKVDSFRVVQDSLTLDLMAINKQGHINGFGVAIANENGVLYERGFGYANKGKKLPYDENTIQHIASISKTLIGISLMKAQEMKLLQLDDPINKYLPFKVVNPHYPDQAITIRHLATHTSSIADTDYYMENAWVMTPDQNLDDVQIEYPAQTLNSAERMESMEVFLRKVLVPKGEYYDKDLGFLKNKPGEKFKYSNIGASLAALVLEKASKTSFDAFTKTHILEPLGMSSSGWSLEQIDLEKHSRLYASPEAMLPFYTAITYPDGMLISSASDMAKYLSELIKGHAGKGTLLSATSYSELFKRQLSAQHYDERDENHPYDDEYDTGIFMGFSAKGYIGHGGGDAGVGTWMFFDEKTQTGRFIMKNTDATDRAGELQYYAVWDKMDEYVSKLDSLSN